MFLSGYNTDINVEKKNFKTISLVFVGSTIIYSYLQAIGIINAHGKECALYEGKCYENNRT